MNLAMLSVCRGRCIPTSMCQTLGPGLWRGWDERGHEGGSVKASAPWELSALPGLNGFSLARCPALALPWGVFLGSAPHPAASHRVH